MRKLKHLPLDQWPEADIEAFKRAYETGDIFDESLGPGAHHSRGWRMMVETSYRRWLGFLAEQHQADLLKPPGGADHTRDSAGLCRATLHRGPADHRRHVHRQSLRRRAIDSSNGRLALAGISQSQPRRPRRARGSLQPSSPCLVYPRLRDRPDGRGAYPADLRPQATRNPIS